MKKQLGFILKTNKNYALLIIPFHFISSSKYQKLQIKLKKYYILNYRQEYIKGDIVLFDSKKNKIYIYYK